MAKDDKKKMELEAATDVAIPESTPVVEAAPSAPESPVAPDPVVNFDRWFATLGKPDHWKDGMRRFVDTKGKRPLSVWAQLFKNY